jgi:hypothetical protein
METNAPNPMHFVTEAYRRQLDLELFATRGRSTWRDRRTGRRWRLFTPLRAA